MTESAVVLPPVVRGEQYASDKFHSVNAAVFPAPDLPELQGDNDARPHRALRSRRLQVGNMLGWNTAKSKSWSNIDDELLVELAQRGVSKARIAVQLRRREASIKRRAGALGIKIKPIERLPRSCRQYRSVVGRSAAIDSRGLSVRVGLAR